MDATGYESDPEAIKQIIHKKLCLGYPMSGSSGSWASQDARSWCRSCAGHPDRSGEPTPGPSPVPTRRSAAASPSGGTCQQGLVCNQADHVTSKQREERDGVKLFDWFEDLAYPSLLKYPNSSLNATKLHLQSMLLNIPWDLPWRRTFRVQQMCFSNNLLVIISCSRN